MIPADSIQRTSTGQPSAISNGVGSAVLGNEQGFISARKEQSFSKAIQHSTIRSGEIQNNRGINGKASGEGLVGATAVHETIQEYGALRFIDGSCAETCSGNLYSRHGGTAICA